jgi:triacylglycerol esterase/lipase EstA (alpha/beta hydrolase family)
VRRAHVALLAALGLALAACASPVRAVRVERTVAHRDLTRSAITTGEASWPTRDALLERGLLELYDERPEQAIAALHRSMVAERGAPDLLFALAELSFLHGQKTGEMAPQLAAAVYAYAFLFSEQGGPPTGPFDPRFRLAADLYNWSLGAALATQDGSEVVPRGGEFALPFGSIAVDFDPAELRAGNRELHGFVPIGEFEVHGLATRYRRPGLGTPLAASTRPVEGAGAADMVAPRLKVEVTALLRIEHARQALVAERPLRGVLELHLAWDADRVAIAGEQVPLEREPTAALALTFTGMPIMELEIFGLLGRLAGQERPPLVSTTPYTPGLVPVVFVHGTGSSIMRWAEMYNRLLADPEIRSRYQFWFFQYDSGNPIAASALRLREALSGAVAKLDPEAKDPALRKMVLIGHSQGGLLVKMQAIDTGDRLWNAVSRKPLEELRLSDETRELLQRGLFVEPLPYVSRVVFISTPHRGSYIAGYKIIANLTRRLASLPLQLTTVSVDVLQNRDAMKSPFMPTAVDNMSPRHPFIQGLQQIPIAPPIEAHSIISVKQGMEPVEDGNDGVVAYKSAHILPIESELVVRSPHSCQGNPHTMEEVRRILRLHVGVPLSAAPLDAPRD